ncbi:MAG: alpha/beta hydrolase [Patescibacteria group bacterium]
MKKVFILHGCPSFEKEGPEQTYAKHWMPWIERELIERGYEVVRPMMPEPWAPKYAAFKEEFEKNEIPDDAILIGHSCGAAFLVRWLGDTKHKASQLILVAPWKIPDEGDVGRQKYYGYDIDKTIPSRVPNIVMFTSDTEEEEGKESVKIFHEALGGKLIELKNKGHYKLGEMGGEEFPELLEEIL